MNRQEFENALNELDILLSVPNINEDYLQKWFENHSIVFDLLGYKHTIPHPQLRTENNELLIPDFLVQKFDGIWEIFEIKRPDTDVLKNRKTRVEFYSSFRDYISQCHEYNEFFDDSANREKFNSENGISVQKNLKSTVIAGRNKGLKREEIQKILFREGAKITHSSYDDIRTTIEYHRCKSYSQYDGVKGITFSGLVTFRKLENKNNFLFDFGRDAIRNRVSVFIDPDNHLTLRVIDDDKRDYLIKIEENSYGFQYEKECFLCFEIGVSKDTTMISLEIDGKYFRDIILDNIKLNTNFIFDHTGRIHFNFVLATDIELDERANFDFSIFAIHKTRLNFEDKAQLRNYYWYGTDERPILSMSNQYGVSVKHQKYPEYYKSGAHNDTILIKVN